MNHRKKFTIYDCDESSVLNVIQHLADYTNKIPYQDHKGSWQGLDRPTLSDEGMRATVEKLNSVIEEQPFYFNTVEDMKKSTNIKVGSICITLGYYNEKDGGGATYKITENSPLGNGFSFAINEDLTAELIYSNEVNIKQLGCRSFDDEGNKVDMVEYLQMYISKSSAHENSGANKQILKLYIPPGRWFSSPFKFKCSSIYIHGNNNYSYPYATGTIIAPIGENQTHLWIFGDDTSDLPGREYGNIALKNIMFTTYKFNNGTGIALGGATYDKCYNVGKILSVCRVYGGVFENIHFTNYLGVPLSIASSNESIFNDFTFRNGDSFEHGQVVFDADIVDGIEGVSKNISACFFDKFSFEGVKGHLFNFKTNSKYINNHIGTVIFEDRDVKISKDGTIRNYVASSDESKTFKSKAVFNIEENNYCELTVDNVYLNNFGRCVISIYENEYLFDTIVNQKGKVSKGCAIIKVVSHTGARRDTKLLNCHDYSGLGSKNFNFVCENAFHNDVSTRRFFVDTKGGMKPYIKYKNILYNRFIDFIRVDDKLLNKNSLTGHYMPVITDNESITPESLVVNNLNYKQYVYSYDGEISSIKIPVVGNILKIRMKTKVGVLVQCYDDNDTTNYQNKTIKETQEIYKWHTIDLTDFRTNNLGKDLSVVIRTLTSDTTNYAYLDVFYWE